MSKKSKLVEGEEIDSTKEERKERKEKKDKKDKKEKSDKGDKTEKKKESKSKSKTAESSTPKSLFDAPAKAVDDSLASLFSTNAGPVKIAVINSRRSIVQRKEREVEANTPGDEDEDEDQDEEIPSEVANALAARDEALNKDRKKKRKRATEPEIEDVYMDKLRDEEPETRKKQKKSAKGAKEPKKEKAVEDTKGKEDEEMAEIDKADDVDAKSSSENDGDGLSSENEEADGDENEEDESEGGEDDDDEGEDGEDDDSEEEEAPKERIRHETEGDLQNRELEKANCTVFVGNLPSSIISDKAQYKTLQSAFKAHGVVSSIRFRSIAFSDQIPRKAAFITKALHVDQNNVNAYIVFKTPEAARSSLQLNGTIVLNHHIRVDSVAHPAKNDSRKCVFVGNLDFEAAEESLWKHFSTCGKVENVRLVRDAKTNVGKGFAYVQFADDVDVEKALLLNEKPMEVEKGRKRKLRVTRAKNMRKKAVPDSAPGAARSAKKNGVYVPKADPRQSGAAGRAGKLFGKAGGAKIRKMEDTGVYEGTRAAPGMDVGLRTGGSGKKKGGARARKTVRSAAWKQKSAK
ncbi:Nucleolar protein 12 [Orbilia oligospora]|nr:Nucleolar protein 12 [Orbilia oligospora]KAF3240812.1 Nucleolar protein 12 [Orbilia oligospora]KAF3253175.1 Nucleolar protein 12 [Orbilia oligospora]KAF3277146.1 Nucleolar protein 12 [Orbilia oligospora]